MAGWEGAAGRQVGTRSTCDAHQNHAAQPRTLARLLALTCSVRSRDPCAASQARKAHARCTPRCVLMSAWNSRLGHTTALGPASRPWKARHTSGSTPALQQESGITWEKGRQGRELAGSHRLVLLCALLLLTVWGGRTWQRWPPAPAPAAGPAAGSNALLAPLAWHCLHYHREHRWDGRRQRRRRKARVRRNRLQP